MKTQAATVANQAKSAQAESFSERKARYDRERAARKEAEKKAAEEQAAKQAVEASNANAGAAEGSKAPSADELYGTVSKPKEGSESAETPAATEEKGE